MQSGVALTETCTDAGQLVFICRSSWWKHFNCSSKSDRHISVWCTVGFNWNTWLLTARLCSKRKGGKIMPSRTGNVSLSSSSSKRKQKSLGQFHPKDLTTENTHAGFLLLFMSANQWFYQKGKIIPKSSVPFSPQRSQLQKRRYKHF